MGMMDINSAKSYATLRNLEAALTKLGFIGERFMVAYTATGRATAIFSLPREGGDVMRFSRHGFITFG